MDDTLATLRRVLAGRYDVQREIGHGGMATVFLAHDLKHNRPVAIKALDPMLSLSVGRERFLREIETVARLSHPHILPLHDSGSAEGLLYFVMPYVEGESLRERLRHGPLPIDEAIDLATEVADGLGFAHEHGVIHRDVKPENILLSAGHARIADFGIARARTGGASQGVPIGTPEYMSPEQVAGDQPGPASDEYSLACVVHEMLTGEPPFSGPTAQAILYRRLTSLPPSVRDRRPEVPDLVAQAVLQGLAKDPAERFGSPVAFARALRRPPPGLTTGSRQAARAVVVLPFENLSPDPADAFFADGLTEEVTAELAKVPGLAVISRTTAMRYRNTGKDLPTIARELGVGYVLEGSVRRAGQSLRMTAQLVEGKTDKHLWAEQFTGTVDEVFAVQERFSRKIVEALEVAFAPRGGTTPRRVPHPDAYAQYLKGRYFFNKRGPSLRRAKECFEQAIRIDPGFAPAHAALAEAEVMLCWYLLERPGEGFGRARAAALRALELDPTLAMAHNALAFTLLWHDWNFAAALQSFERALALDPSYPTAHHWYGEFLTATGRHDEALQEARRAKGLDPLGLILSAMVAFACYFGRRFDEAITETRQSLELDPSFMPLYPWLVAGLIGAGRIEEAIEAAYDAARLAGDEWVTQPLLGVALARAGRADEARAVLARLETLARTAPVSPIDLGVIHLALGERDTALAELARGRAERDVRLPLVRYDPLWDAVRDDPRFAPLLP